MSVVILGTYGTVINNTKLERENDLSITGDKWNGEWRNQGVPKGL